jgi:hypothetical protein
VNVAVAGPPSEQPRDARPRFRTAELGQEHFVDAGGTVSPFWLCEAACV